MKKLGKSRDLGHLAVKLYDELAEWCEILRWPAVSGNRDILCLKTQGISHRAPLTRGVSLFRPENSLIR